MIIFELLAGRRPFPSASSSALRIPNGISSDCKDVLMGLLQRDRQKRWSGMDLGTSTWVDIQCFEEMPDETPLIQRINQNLRSIYKLHHHEYSKDLFLVICDENGMYNLLWTDH